jgi:hypothetical protein
MRQRLSFSHFSTFEHAYIPLFLESLGKFHRIRYWLPSCIHRRGIGRILETASAAWLTLVDSVLSSGAPASAMLAERHKSALRQAVAGIVGSNCLPIAAYKCVDTRPMRMRWWADA